LLTGSRRGRRSGARQRTLESSIAWSFDLLDEDEEAMLCRLAVFPSSFDLAGARAVGTPDDPRAALDLLGSLVDKSLVAARPLDGDRPYRLLESIGHYARLRLHERGDDRAARLAHLRHTATQIDVLSGGGHDLDDYAIRPVVEVPSALREDLFAAEATALATGRHDQAVDLYWPIYMTVILSGDHRAATPVLQEALAADGTLDLEHEARALGLLLGCLGSANRQREELDLGDRALRVARELAAAGTLEPLQPVLTALAHATSFVGRDGAADLAREAVDVARGIGARRNERGWVAYAAPWCAIALAQDGFEQEGMALAEEGLADGDAAGFDHLAALCAIYAAVIGLRLRPSADCRRLLERARRRIPAAAPRLHALLAGTAGVWNGVLAGDPALTAEWLEHGLGHAGPPGSGTYLLMANARVVERFGRGDWDGVADIAEQVAVRVERFDNRWWQVHARLMVAAAEIGRDGAAAPAAVQRLQDLLPPGRVFPLLTWMTQGMVARLHLSRGRPQEALDQVCRIAGDGHGDATIGRLQWALPLAVAAFAGVGDAEASARALGALERYEAETGRLDLDRAATTAAATAARAACGGAAFEAARTAGSVMTVEDARAWLRDSGDGPA
jgi:hypothetical protein